GTARPKSERSTKGSARAATAASGENAKTIEPAPPADAAGSDPSCAFDSSHPDACRQPGSKPRN
ncbi:MAG TPA: hypothetical protein VGD80_44335, partial [Kofleriaceae bacterium]